MQKRSNDVQIELLTRSRSSYLTLIQPYTLAEKILIIHIFSMELACYGTVSERISNFQTSTTCTVIHLLSLFHNYFTPEQKNLIHRYGVLLTVFFPLVDEQARGSAGQSK